MPLVDKTQLKTKIRLVLEHRLAYGIEMPITDPKTVLIIGAGASAPFGLPLGGPIMEMIREALNADVGKFFESREGPPHEDRRAQIYWAKMSPILRAYSLHLGLKGSDFYYVTNQLKDASKILTGQTSETIDDFIAINSNIAPLMKIAVATVFFNILYECNADNLSFTRKSLSVRQLPSRDGPRRNWIHLLINLIRHGVFNNTIHPNNKVKIINFNYDGIVETVLSEQFDNTGHNFGDWRDYVEIVHPHGYFGEFPLQLDHPMDAIISWANSIGVINEAKVPEAVTNARMKASQWIDAAEDVYMAGFALSGPNARMLGLNDREDKLPQTWHVCNFDGSPGVRRAAKRYEFEGKSGVVKQPDGVNLMRTNCGAVDVQIEAGTRADPLHIDTWFSIGVPGELPG